jgi:hypothetical protein
MVKTMPTYLDFVRYEYNGGGILLYLICDKSKTLTEGNKIARHMSTLG